MNKPGNNKIDNEWNSLPRVLAEAGGWKDNANLSTIIIRRSHGEETKVFYVNFLDMIQQKGKAKKLHHGDIIYIQKLN